MKIHTLSLVSALLFTTINFAQSPGFVEIEVDEIVVLKAESITVVLSVFSRENQIDRNQYLGLENDQGMEFEDVDGEFMYNFEETMLYRPEEITKEGKKRYTKMKKRMEEINEAERKRREEFKPYTIKDLIKMMEKDGIPYEIIRQAQGEYSGYEEYEYEESEDTMLIVKVTSNEQYNVLMDKTHKLPVMRRHGELTYETIDKYTLLLIPKMTKKAETEAAILALSMHKSLGGMTSCTNVLPNGFSSKATQFYLTEQRNENNNSYPSNVISPLNKTQKGIISYIFRFELKN